MTEQLILRELNNLPESLKIEVLHFVQFLKQERVKETKTQHPKRQAGLLKGKIWIAPDFDVPLDDFKEYM
ncbi:MAG: DUF2281 domain-containing protein [Saprospiraceae bacterium]|nr:DUF2281 domain-containing protein [Saprospiraceae bacterium]